MAQSVLYRQPSRWEQAAFLFVLPNRHAHQTFHQPTMLRLGSHLNPAQNLSYPRHFGWLCIQVDTPLEKQLSRWRHEVFKLLLSSKQAQHAQQQYSQAQAEVITKLQQQVISAEDKATLLDSRLLDRHVDLDLAHVRSRRAEEQLQQSCR